MKKLIFLSILLLCFSCNDNGVGNNQSPVQDFAKIFSDKEEEILTKKIIDFKKATDKEICIYTLDSLPENMKNSEIAAAKLAFDIGIDSEEKKKGLLILISEHDQEFAFAKGVETKKVFTNSIHKKISDDVIIPLFRQEKYFDGVSAALDEITTIWK